MDEIAQSLNPSKFGNKPIYNNNNNNINNNNDNSVKIPENLYIMNYFY